MRFGDLRPVSCILHVWVYLVPRSLTSTALLFLRPVSWTVTSRTLVTDEPSLPFVTLNRWIENFEAFAISSKIWEVEASELTVIVSGRFLIGRPVEGSVYLLLGNAEQENSCFTATGDEIYLEGARRA